MAVRTRGGMVAVLAAALVVALPAEAREPRECQRFCVSVTPTEGGTQTVFVFRGRGWLPDRNVSATFGLYCPPNVACPALGVIKTFRTSDSGRFTFRFRNGPELPPGAGPKAKGGGPVTFSQTFPGGRRAVHRTPRFVAGG